MKILEEVNFETLKGKTFSKIYAGQSHEGDTVFFEEEPGSGYVMFHIQNCCEHVYLEDIEGDLNALAGEPLSYCYESSDNIDDPPPNDNHDESYTWTFYRMGNAKGDVVLRWFGTSNGYYSESVDLYKATWNE